MLFYMILGLFMGDGNYRENWDLFLMIKSKQKRFLLFTVYYTAIKFKEGYFHDFYGIVYMHFFLCIILIYIFFSHCRVILLRLCHLKISNILYQDNLKKENREYKGNFTLFSMM